MTAKQTTLLSEINRVTGFNLQPAGGGKASRKYFNVELNERTSESALYVRLESYCKQRGIRMEPNGLTRVAIWN